MTDIVTPEARSRIMSGIRGKDTKPELVIRKGLHSMGFRYKLHVINLPGKPDLVLPRYSAIIFVNGCFWHGHDCHLFKWPSTRIDFWHKKITRNQQKDTENLSALLDTSWRVLVIWECALKGKMRRPVESVLEETVVWIKSESKHLEIKGGGGLE